MYVSEGRSIGGVGYVIGTVVTIFAIVVTTIIGLIFIILPICGFLWTVGKHITNWELPMIAPIDAIVMTVFLGIPIFAFIWVVVSGLWPSHKGKLTRSYI